MKTTKIKSPAYAEYRPSLAVRIAQERAAKDQPPLLALSSKVPNYAKEAK